MRRIAFARSTLRRARFERLDDRLVFSSNPLIDVCVVETPDMVRPLPDWSEIAPALAPLGASIDPTAAAQVRSAYGLTGAGQTVAIIDSGIAYDHPALGAGFGSGHKVVAGWDFTEESDSNPYDDGPAGFHGTHVAGIIASQDTGRSGVAPGVDLVALRVFNDMGMGFAQWVEQALNWVHAHRDDFRYPITTVNLSLGSAWNGSDAPAWATLEEELATLADDGIFVAVAAGNSYSEFGRPGLAYPAASPYVVPVASTDDSGRLSDFSQRLDRILAAPGEDIISTVPKHVFGDDGDPNDWTMASGTSMAAPYLAGASMLVREAMQFVGTASIDQSTIAEQLRTTAETVVDPVSGVTYYRLDLPKAIDTILPADDYGSDHATAYELGTVDDHRTVDGQLARLNDRDYFRFTAGSSGELTLRLESTAPIDVGFDALLSVSSGTDGTFRYEIEAGKTYTMFVAAKNRIANYSIQLALSSQSPVQIVGDRVLVSGTSRSDTIRFAFNRTVEITVNEKMFVLPEGRFRHFALHGNHGEDLLIFEGSASSDEVIFRAGSAEMRGSGYSLTADSFHRIRAIAGDGQDDVARFFATPHDNQFVAAPGHSTIHSGEYRNEAIGFDRVYAYASVGVDDVARFHDSIGNDEFVAGPNASLMRGPGFFAKAIGFDRVYAHGSKSGDDVARFYDSPANDEYRAGANHALMIGPDFYNKALNFNRTYAYASQGGDDVARLQDSMGNDLYVGRGDESYLRGDEFYNKAIGFDRVYASASNGCDDVARLYDAPGNDEFIGTPLSSALYGTGYYLKAMQFDRVYAYASTGSDDVAYLTGSEVDDRLLAWTDRQILRGPGYYTAVRGFDRTYADPLGSGGDAAFLYDSPASERYSAGPLRSVWSSDSGRVELRRFQQISASSSAGGNDVVELRLDGSATQFIGKEDLALGIAQDTRFELRGFAQVTLDLGERGLDALYLSSVDYLFEQIGALQAYGPARPQSSNSR